MVCRTTQQRRLLNKWSAELHSREGFPISGLQNYTAEKASQYVVFRTTLQRRLPNTVCRTTQQRRLPNKWFAELHSREGFPISVLQNYTAEKRPIAFFLLC
jgi:hypothetical protein